MAWTESVSSNIKKLCNAPPTEIRCWKVTVALPAIWIVAIGPITRLSWDWGCIFENSFRVTSSLSPEVVNKTFAVLTYWKLVMSSCWRLFVLPVIFCIPWNSQLMVRKKHHSSITVTNRPIAWLIIHITTVHLDTTSKWNEKIKLDNKRLERRKYSLIICFIGSLEKVHTFEIKETTG